MSKNKSSSKTPKTETVSNKETPPSKEKAATPEPAAPESKAAPQTPPAPDPAAEYSRGFDEGMVAGLQEAASKLPAVDSKKPASGNGRMPSEKAWQSMSARERNRLYETQPALYGACRDEYGF